MIFHCYLAIWLAKSSQTGKYMMWFTFVWDLSANQIPIWVIYPFLKVFSQSAWVIYPWWFTHVPFSQFLTQQNKTNSNKTSENWQKNNNIWLWIEWFYSTHISSKSALAMSSFVLILPSLSQTKSTIKLVINNLIYPCCSC